MCFLPTVVLGRFTGLAACGLSRPRFAATFVVDVAGVDAEVLPLCGSAEQMRRMMKKKQTIA